MMRPTKKVLTSFSIVAQSNPANLQALEGLCFKCIVEQKAQVAKGGFHHSRWHWSQFLVAELFGQ